MELFKVENGELIILYEEVLLIREFKALYHRKTEYKGAEKQRVQVLEFMYVKKMAQQLISQNIYAALSEETKSEKLIIDLGFPRNWEVDQYITDAVNKYIEIITSHVPTANLLNSILRSMMTTSSVVDSLNKQLNRQLKLIQGETTLSTAELEERVSIITDTITKLLKIGSQVPDTIKSLKGLEETVAKEMALEKRKKGGGKIGKRENPMVNNKTKSI